MRIDGIQGVYVPSKKPPINPLKKAVGRIRDVIATPKKYTHKDRLREQWSNSGSSLSYREYATTHDHTIKTPASELVKRFK